MDKIKKLNEKRAAIIKEMEQLTEERAFDAFDAKNLELDALDKEIAAEQRMIDLKMTKVDAKHDDVDVASEIRSAIENNEELSLENLEVRMQVMGNTSGQNVSVGNIKKETFADYIIGKLPYVSPLYGATRKEVLGSALHSIPVQKSKIGKFVRMAELQNYAAQNADFNTIKLEATKFGTMIQFSEEVVQDLGYDIESELLNQLMEAYATTLDELIVTGDKASNIDGLTSFTTADGIHQVTQAAAGTITADELLDVYYALPIQYRNAATWVISDETARELSKLKFATGQPVLFESFSGGPVGANTTILGRPVIINNFVPGLTGAGTSIYFGDLQKAIIVGPRKTLTIKRSDELGFVNDSIAIKANVRLDIKKALGEAMATYKNAASQRAAK